MFCCEMMEKMILDEGKSDCETKKAITYSARFDEYLIPLSEGNRSGVCIAFCPWCGKKLPDSKRKKWFEELDQLGIEYSLLDTENIPFPYLSDAWWNDHFEDKARNTEKKKL